MTAVLYWFIQAVSVALLALMAAVTVRERDAICAVVRHTWKEAIRSRALWLVMLFILTLLFATTFLEATGTGLTKEERRIRIVLETSLRVMTAFAVITAIFATSMSLPSDISDRRAFTLLSKPVSRWGLICGKAVGFSLFTSVMLALMGLAMAGFVRWAARSAPPEVKRHLLGARELIRADSMTLLTRRAGEVKDGHLVLTMRPEIPPGSMYRFELTEEMMKSFSKPEEPIPVKFIFGHFRDKQDKPVYSEEELKDCSMVIEIVEPNATTPGKPLPAKVGPEMKIEIDSAKKESKAIRVQRGYFTETAKGEGNRDYGLGIRVVGIRPATRMADKVPFIREAENAHWEFRDLDRSSLEAEPEDIRIGGEDATPATPAASAPASATGKRIGILVYLRLVNRSGYYAGSRYEDLRFWYRLPSGEMNHETVRTRDARRGYFTIPGEAVTPEGTLVLDLENPMGTKTYYGYDNIEYSIFLLSAPRSFEFNVLKAVAMIGFQVMLLVVVAVSVSTFLSWPVAAMTALFVYFCGEIVSTFGEMIEALEKGGFGHHHGPVQEKGMTWFDHVVKAVLEVLRVVMPDMDRFSPLGWLGEGYSLTFPELFASFLYMNIFVTASLAVGWLIFRKRSID